MTTLNGNGNEHHPQRLGDVRLQNTRSGWELWVKGHKTCERLSTAQALSLIRGEATLAAIVNSQLKETSKC